MTVIQRDLRADSDTGDVGDVGEATPGTLITVNGSARSCVSAPSTRLADVLRDELGLTGTKIGCNSGDCGACTVLVDGRQRCSCLTALGSCAGRTVETVEALADGGVLNRLQRAFLVAGATQCGICTPGMLMAATDLLRQNPRPVETEVQDALAGVLCRCTGYTKIVEAVLLAASDDPLAGGGAELEPVAGAAVGARLARLDGPSKVNGVTAFGADEAPHGTLWMRVVRSPHASARFELGDLDLFVRSHPGLTAIVSARDVPFNRFAVFDVPKDQPVFAEAHVRMRGEAVLALVGTRRSVETIVDADLPIVWSPDSPLMTAETALAENAELVHDFASGNVLCRGRVVKGDVEAALDGADFVATGHFETAYVEHAYIEPEAGYAEIEKGFDRDGKPVDRLRIFACTQTPYMDRDEVARVMKLPVEQIHIVPSAIGGGFGGKLDVSIQPLLAVAVWKLKCPVRIVYRRSESMLSTTKRHPSSIDASYACDRDGFLTALRFRGDFNTGAYASWGSTVANRVPVHATGPYVVDNVEALTRAVYTNNAISGAFRGFGVPQAHVATEALLDDLARQCGIDGLQFRLRNAIRKGGVTATGQVLEASVGIVACLRALEAPWAAAREAHARFNHDAMTADSPLRRGRGVASMWYGIGNTVIANPSTMRVALRANGRLFLYNGAQEIGQGTATIMPQILADALGVPVTLIDQVMGDTDRCPDAGKSSASRQTFVSGNAVKFAGEQLRERLFALIGAPRDGRLEIRVENGAASAVAVTPGGEQKLRLDTLVQDGEGNVLFGEGYFNPPTIALDENGQGVPYATYGFAAQMAEVEVDLELGTVRVIHIHAAHDIGRAINPTQVEGQIHGGIAQGLGMALMEEYVSGKTDNLHDYLIPTVGDMPVITTILVEDAEPLGPFGAKGVGEPALVATAPAILNAIQDASGCRIRSLPATPDRIRKAILLANP